ncbi:hypothetical protein ACFQV2_39045 [Actinokineospora soli]|uniref:Pyridoxamine 5'-phosphate oxidase n=1 Tax=Actinokineospora soli TaxID=1048753 RepID=A0ABW2TYY8_9PSEU
MTDLVGAFVTPNRALLGRMVAANTVHFAVSGSGRLVLHPVPGFGTVMCVFTSRDLLAEYQVAVGAPSSDRLESARGRKVVARVVRDGTVGLSVNPLGGGGSPHGRSWTAEELRAL